jgi:hypothetical protein
MTNRALTSTATNGRLTSDDRPDRADHFGCRPLDCDAFSGLIRSYSIGDRDRIPLGYQVTFGIRRQGRCGQRSER